MSQSERDQSTRTEPFRLTVDQYGRVWLFAKLEGLEVPIDLADKEQAFQIMAEQNFKYLPNVAGHGGPADNDDEQRS